LEPKVAPATAELGGFLASGVLAAAVGLRVFAVMEELLAPLGLGGLDSWGDALAALGPGGFLALRVSSPLCASFVEELGSMSCGVKLV
jgi:hypothetical protein